MTVRVSAIWTRARSGNPFAADAVLTAVTNIFIAALGMISGILAARLLGPRGRGELAAIQTWASAIAALAMLGMPEAVIYYSAREPHEAGRYLGSGILVALSSSAPFAVIGYLLMPMLLGIQAPAIVQAGRWYLLLVPIYALVGMLLHPLRGRGDFAPWNAMRLAPNALWIGVLAYAWISARVVPTFVAAANLIALAMLFFPFAAVLVSRVPGPFLPDPRKVPSMLRYGVPCSMTTIPQMLNLRLDQMLMAGLLAPRLLGLYVVAVAWSGMMSPLLQAVGAVLFPHVASQNSPEERSRAFVRIVRLAAPLAATLAVAVALATPWGLPLVFGRAFAGAIPSALVLVLAGAVLSLDQLLEEGFKGLGYPACIMWAEFGGLAVTAVSLLCLLKPMGIMGAAVSSVLGYGTVGTLLLIQARRVTGYSTAAMLFPTRCEVQEGWMRIRLLVWRQA